VPELPEVETAVRRLRPAVVGRRLVALTTHHASARRALPDDVASQLAGRRIDRVDRLGKHQLLRLDDGSALHAQFRMNGDWELTPAGAALPPHARVALHLCDTRDDVRVVALVDPRALATVAWRPAGVPDPALGPDAASPALDAGALAAALRGRRVAIKPALLDQRVLAGVGNIYASEALWRSGIDPRTPAGALGPRRLARLADAIRATLADALADAGRYQDGEALARLAVYDRAGAECRRCATPVRRVVQAGRSTYFCPRCQRH
jgi:formamidopyrimidine-DNA glycosylase